MYSLDPSTTVTAVLDAAATTTAPTFTVTYSDVALTSGVVTARKPYATATGAMTGTTAVTIVASPTTGYAREIENIAFRNKDTVSHTITLGGAVDLSFAVPAGQVLSYDGHSWRLGADNTVQMAGDVTGSSSANTVGKIGGYSVTLSGSVSLAGPFTQTGAYSWGLVVPGAYTYTLPAATGTLASLALSQTFGGDQTFLENILLLPGDGHNIELRHHNNYGVRFLLDASNANLYIQSNNNGAYATLMTIETLHNLVSFSSDIFGSDANTYYCGTAASPWAGGYFQTAPVVTSAQAAKINWRYFTDAEKAAAAILVQKCPRLFQLKTSVAEKGADKARFHAGVLYEELYAVLQAAGFADVDIERFSLFCASPAKKAVIVKTRTVSRQKTKSKTRTVESIAVTDGVAVLTTTTETYDAPVYEALPVKDTSGAVVYEADGKTERTYQSPVMEDVAETYTEEEDDIGATPIHGIRYTELDTWYVVGLLKLNDDRAVEIAALTARVAALEAKAAA